MTEDQKSVVAIAVDSPPVAGQLKSVNAEKNTITVTVGNRTEKQDKTYSIAKGAKITIDGKDSNLADLREGVSVGLVISEGNVTQIRSSLRRERNQ